jgi:hypothetical protein
MPSYKSAFGSYIKAEDLQGKAIRASIERVEIEEIKGQDGSKERKLVAHFVGKDKGLVLNRTNADALNDIFGTDDYDHWTGTVILYPDTTTFGGKRVACVRVKGAAASQPVQTVPEPEPVPLDDSDIPF